MSDSLRACLTGALGAVFVLVGAWLHLYRHYLRS